MISYNKAETNTQSSMSSVYALALTEYSMLPMLSDASIHNVVIEKFGSEFLWFVIGLALQSAGT